MAMQAQYPSDAFSPDFGGWSPSDYGFNELQMLQDGEHRPGNLLVEQRILSDGMVLSNAQSELTCNVSGSRKRNRDHPGSMSLSQPPGQNQGVPQQLQCPNPMKTAGMTSGLQQPLAVEQGRMYGSVGASTSGRPITVSASSPVVSVSPLAQDLVSHLHQQSVEMDALIRLQTDRLRWGLEEARKRHCRALLSVVQRQGVKRLRDRETELENASRRNAELEEKVKQMAAENQYWFNVAKNNEAIVSGLRTSLEQVLLQTSVSAAVTAPQAKDGYGDSDGIPSPADDAESCCFEDEEKERKVTAGADEAAFRRENEEVLRQRACQVCQEREVCVLLLPCRHLCLCKDCESKLDTCPVCHSTNSASLQIFMS